MSERHRFTFVVHADHPSLPGHFPGTPVVPGVLMLDHVLGGAEAWRRQPLSVRGLKHVKFHSPLLPEDTAEVMLTLDGGTLEFQVLQGERAVAQGAFLLAVAASA